MLVEIKPDSRGLDPAIQSLPKFGFPWDGRIKCGHDTQAGAPKRAGAPILVRRTVFLLLRSRKGAAATHGGESGGGGFLHFAGGGGQNLRDLARALIRAQGKTTLLQDEDFGHESFMAQMHDALKGGARVLRF